MRYKLLFFWATIFGALSASAQDTINEPAANYFVPGWPTDDSSRAILEKSYRIGIEFNEYGGIFAKKLYTSSPLTIYGMAAALRVGGPSYDHPDWTPVNLGSRLIDSSYDSCYEYFRICRATGNGYELAPIAETQVNATDTPVAFIRVGPVDMTPIPPRVFESYFDTPITVTDTFYAGITQHLLSSEIIDGVQCYPSWSIRIATVEPSSYSSYSGPWLFNEYYREYSPYFGWIEIDFPEFLLIMPIIDTSTSSDGIGEVGLGHFVSVSPNPASEQVRIYSIFGLSHIEAYDATGRLVYKHKASGSEALIDTRSWPSGTYLLSVNTPLGLSNKKVTIRR